MVLQLANELQELDFAVWIDRASLAPGARWKSEIRRAIADGAAFIACFSPSSQARERSYMREELALAVDELRLRPRDKAWFIPVVIEPANIPEIPTGGTETLRDLQHVALYGDWDEAIRRLVGALRPIDAVVDSLLNRADETERYDKESRLATLDNAVRLIPRRRDARRARALARIALGQAAAAVDDYEEVAPEFPSELAWCYWLADDADSALAAYKRLVRRGRATAQDAYDLGCLLYAVPRAAEALAAFRLAVALAPSEIAPRLAALRLMLRMDDHEETIRFATETEDQFGQHADLFEARGVAAIYRSGALHPGRASDEMLAMYDHGYIVKQLGSAHQVDPGNARRLYRAAMLFFQLRDYENSRDAATLGLKLVPNSTSFRVVLAQLHEYGTDNKLEGVKRSAQLYAETTNLPLDGLQEEEPFPTLSTDDRDPRPAMPKYATVPLTVAGVVTA